MKTLGLVGGMSWHSTASYSRLINEAVADELGGHASAKIILQWLDFSEIRECQVSGDWERAADLLTEAARHCQTAGADAVAICTNLMHKVAPQVEAMLDVPLLHIADAVASEARRSGWTRLGILATQWLMEETFYPERLSLHGVSAVMPDSEDRRAIDSIIWAELTRGIITHASRQVCISIIEKLASQGAEAVALACTEIGLLIGPNDSPLPLIDSAEAHPKELARIALGGT